MSDVDIRKRLREWIEERTARRVADDTLIFETGLLSSMDVVELILFVETLMADEIDLEIMDPEVFASIDTIVAGFFPAHTGG